MQHNPYGMSEEGEMDAITEFAHVQRLKARQWLDTIQLGGRQDRDAAQKRYGSTDQAENYKLWFSAKNVPAACPEDVAICLWFRCVLGVSTLNLIVPWGYSHLLSCSSSRKTV